MRVIANAIKQITYRANRNAYRKFFNQLTNVLCRINVDRKQKNLIAEIIIKAAHLCNLQKWC